MKSLWGLATRPYWSCVCVGLISGCLMLGTCQRADSGDISLCVSAGEILLHLPWYRQGICQVWCGPSEVDQTVHGDQCSQPEEVHYRCWLRKVPGPWDFLSPGGKMLAFWVWGMAHVERYCHLMCVRRVPSGVSWAALRPPVVRTLGYTLHPLQLLQPLCRLPAWLMPLFRLGSPLEIMSD